jgi:hypothetical protein
MLSSVFNPVHITWCVANTLCLPILTPSLPVFVYSYIVTCCSTHIPLLSVCMTRMSFHGHTFNLITYPCGKINSSFFASCFETTVPTLVLNIIREVFDFCHSIIVHRLINIYVSFTFWNVERLISSINNMYTRKQ